MALLQNQLLFADASELLVTLCSNKFIKVKSIIGQKFI